MAKVLVFAEQRENKLKSYALEAVSAGRAIADASGGEVIACLVGNGVKGLAEGLGKYGAQKVLVADDGRLSAYSPSAYATVMTAAIESENPDVVFFSASAMGRDVAPLTAIKAGTSVVADIVAAEWQGDYLEIKRPVYAGKAFLKVAVNSKPAMATLRPNVFPAEEKSGDGTVVELSFNLSDDDLKVKVTDTQMKSGGRPELTEAGIIVSGGRGMGGPENYPVIEALADTLGAAVGASRAAVDAGWRPHSDQVGQTGKTVSPNLYIACGISGAIQHLAGMSSSKYIVAVNKDPEAPIFKVADYGIVGDLFEVVPELDKAAKQLLEK
ncbi:MAG: electron transfer flavoprotein subunit alpha/FixB family protein [Candidatus Marinimicrobia bacterium]|nr:electron transfer flavoprotein subunit alpha/FixB family protein [Candidatus Neomarinimicrobiota bacterium]MCF7902089.1 electron transfer flavoprotein subunit alpha/FixB family protein [Candidatus Neomarinimicrobiota bacterium]